MKFKSPIELDDAMLHNVRICKIPVIDLSDLYMTTRVANGMEQFVSARTIGSDTM